MLPDLAHPLWLLLPLLVVPAGILAVARTGRRSHRLAALVPDRLRARLLPVDHKSHSLSHRLVSRFLLLSLLGIALARPQWGNEEVTESSLARDIVLAIDTSRSMLATDTPPNRLERAKLACLDLLKALPDDRFGILGFAGSAFPLAPLTTDHDAIRETLMTIDTESLPVGGSDLASAVEVSMEAFSEAGTAQRALVILSDGEDLEGRLDGVAAKAKEKGIFIFAFAIGTERGTMIPSPDTPGGFIRDERGQPVLTRRSTTTLEELAKASGGYAAVLSDQGSLAVQLEQGLAKLDAFSREEKTRQKLAEKYQWPLGAAILALLVCLWLRPRWHRPQGPQTALALGVVFAMSLPLPAKASSTPTNDPATTAAQLHNEGKFTEAIAAGSRALLDRNLNRRAMVSANLGNSLFRAGEVALPKEPEKRDRKSLESTLQDWEDSLSHIDHSLFLRPNHKATQENRQRVQDAITALREELEKLKEQEKSQQQDPKNSEDKKDQQDKKDSQDKQDGKQPESKESKSDKQESPQQNQEQKDANQNSEKSNSQDGEKKDQQSGQESKPDKDASPKDGNSQKDEKSAKEDAQKNAKEDAESKEEKQAQNGKESKDSKEATAAQNNGMDDVSSRQNNQARQQSTVPMKIGRDGKIELPEDPVERARMLEDIRRNLEQRSMENRRVKLLPQSPESGKPKRDW